MKSTTPVLSPRRRGPLFRYGLALVSVALALALGVLGWQYDIRRGQITLFAFAIALAAWYGGGGAAALAVICSCLASAYFFMEPLHSFAVNREELPVFILLILFGTAIGWFGTVRRRAEEELRKQAQLLTLAHDAIIVRDLESRITFWNTGAENTYGWGAAEATGKITHELLQTHFPVSREAVDIALKEHGEWEGELTHSTQAGNTIVVMSRQSLRCDERGAPAGILEINRDVTDRRRAEEELRKLNEELEQRVAERTKELEAVNKELEAFAYSVSHDLRAPVRHIAGFTELLQKHAAPVLDEKSRRHITMILDSANRMGSLVDDLLAFSRIGRAEAQNTDVDLAQTVKSVLVELGPDTQARKITWRIGDLPKCHGDSAMLRLVFTNLISNALKFTRPRPNAEIEIGSRNHQPNEVVVFIKDNGVGFDMKYKDKLFGVFQRLHSQDTFEGTGIGLATVERVVHRHGGRVWAEASLDHGATFFVALPKPER